jgi:methionyl-tRNA formyltransferase
MSVNKQITVLCNNRMAIPAIQTLHSRGLLYGIAIPEGNAELLEIGRAITVQARLPLIVLKHQTFTDQLDALMAGTGGGYVFTMTFPWKIPDAILTKYPGRMYNFHYGLLPEMRGADPVFEALRQQKTESGITVHSIEKQIDKGAVLLKKVLPLNLHLTHGMLCTQLSYLGAQILPEVLALLNAGVKGVEQDETMAKYYKRPGSAQVCINWEKQDAKAIQALAQACNPWNKGAYTQWNGWNIRIVEATAVEVTAGEQQMAGSILTADDINGIRVQCGNNTQLKLDFIYTDEGFMSAHRLAAFGLKKGDRLTSILN